MKLKTQSRRLSVDVASAISELQAMMKEFKLKRDIYRILFRGKGLEFESYRVFSPDDDAADIDWKASSRAQQLLVKQYREERDLKIMFLIDVGSNMVTGSGEKLKCEFVTELAAAFADVILSVNDRIGFFLFSDEVGHYVECKGGNKQLQLFVDILSTGENYGGVTNMDKALDFAQSYLNNSIHSVILISDFLNITTYTEKKLQLLSERFETILIRVRDLLDVTLPDVNGEVIVEDPITSEQVVLNPKIAKKTYERYALEQSQVVDEIFKKSGADYLDLMTNKSFAIPLVTFLKERVVNKL